MDPEKARQISAESAAQLQEGISLLLSRWSALQMAVENEWGGHDSSLKSHQLASDIFSWLTQSKEPLYIDDLENLLDEFMLSLNTEIADGSIEEIAEKLMVMLEECLEGNYKSIQILKETNPPRGAVPHIRQGTSDDDDESVGDDDSSEKIVDAPQSQPNPNYKDMMVDEPRQNVAAEADDGWTVVASRRNKGRGN
ncbi:pre-rRNA-processing protein TSR2-like [Actinidia eriantha]|uniref:pre-rRNA-processing protein TSR2-like n=1 Tax=Actinidia eriantha TaxID=165200 RepID=UPI00258556D4|nr:pre-rRNA-processing protein TSR2-like [Actinidia eriantha]